MVHAVDTSTQSNVAEPVTKQIAKICSLHLAPSPPPNSGVSAQPQQLGVELGD